MRNCLRISAQYSSSFLSNSVGWGRVEGTLSSWAIRLPRKAAAAARPVTERKRRRSSKGTSWCMEEERCYVMAGAGNPQAELLSVGLQYPWNSRITWIGKGATNRRRRLGSVGSDWDTYDA